MKIAVFWGGGEKNYVQKRPWLQLERSDFLQREFFWPRVGVKVMHQWWCSPPQPLRKHWHMRDSIKRLKTQKQVGLKGGKRQQSQSDKKKKTKWELCINNQHTKDIDYIHRLQITAMAKIKSCHAQHKWKRQQRERADIQKGNYEKCHMKAQCGATTAAHMSIITDADVYPAGEYRKLRSAKQTSLISRSLHANTYTPIRLEFDWDECWA